MSEQKEQHEAADGRSRLTDGLEDGRDGEEANLDFTKGNEVLHFHFHSVSYEGVRSAVKQAFESINLANDLLGINRGNGEIETETKCIDETGHIGND